MGFDRCDYLSWYMPRIFRQDGAINLHASGVEPIDLDALTRPGGDPWGHVASFEQALASWLQIEAEEVLFTPGATGGTLLSLLTLSRPESEILVEDPIYEPMLRQAERLAAVRRLRRRRRDGWQLPVEEAADQLAERTAVVMITEPHNPSGRHAPREQVIELAAIAARHGATLLVNEVYRGYSGRPSYHRAADNIVVVSGLSKLMGAYVARLGWVSGTPETIARLRWAHATMGMGNQPAAALGRAILETAEQRRQRAAERAESGRSLVDRWVQATPGVNWLPSEGPGFGCLALPAETDDVALANRLHDDRGVLVVPGTFFERPGTLRLSWLQAGDRLEEGLAALADVLRR